jgi:ABC-2 type transport system permease protein
MNYIGTWTLFKKEVWRFLKVYNQTLIAPVITSLLFLAVFQLSIGDHVQKINGVDFGEFMAAGLIIMMVVQQAFANTSGSITMAKVIGMVIDLLMPPISSGEMVLALVASSIIRGLMVAVIGGIVLEFFVPFGIMHFGVALFYLVTASILLALLGMIAGVLSESFDQMAAITSYIITPLAFLSGTFYSIRNLPPFWQEVAHLNPFFFMIDGFRYGMTGYADGDLQTGAIVLVSSVVILWIAVYKIIDSGYRLKS